MPSIIENEENVYNNEINKAKALNNENSKLLLDFDKRYVLQTASRQLSFLQRIKYLQKLRKCNEYLKGKPLNKLKEKDLELIFSSIKGQNGDPKPWTYNTYVKVLRVWLRWTKQEHLLKSNYLKRVKQNRENDIDPDELPTEEETLSILKAAEQNRDFELCAFLGLLAGSGTRPGSLLG